MSLKKTNLSEYKKFSEKLSDDISIGIVVSEWNAEITDSLCNAAVETLIENGIILPNIFMQRVPGSFELPLGAQYLIRYKNVDAVICLGCVIQGETRHFEFICQAVSHQIARLNIDYGIPVIFGVLTTDNMQQAKDRAGGKHGNKGVEAAVAAIKMLFLRKKI
ncbi:MAG TPA: 6,7-dimethyl-8-ribityllumazine synthase [Bacteroidales bacterium]|nr:6,7-dimethyl-8-ribityllumazine synthase [Bacteroidales bacterium]